jgi:hypothetical protein
VASNGAIIVSDPNRPVTVVKEGATIVDIVTTRTSSPAEIVTVGTRGPVGPAGPSGKSSYEVWLDQGNTGSVDDYFASLSGGSYTHNQMVPNTEWTIAHDLGFFPNVMTFDSAGTQIIGDVDHIDNNSMLITFSHPSGGKAYLS